MPACCAGVPLRGATVVSGDSLPQGPFPGPAILWHDTGAVRPIVEDGQQDQDRRDQSGVDPCAASRYARWMSWGRTVFRRRIAEETQIEDLVEHRGSACTREGPA